VLMPGPMPPSQGMPPKGPIPQEPADVAGGGAGAAKFLMSVDNALDQVHKLIINSKATSPQEKQMITMIDDMFGKLMESLGAQNPDNESEEPMGDGQGQTVPPEAAGNKGAIPSPM